MTKTSARSSSTRAKWLRLRGAFLIQCVAGQDRRASFLVIRMRPALVLVELWTRPGKVLEDAITRLAPDTGPEINDVVDVDVTYKVDCTLRKYQTGRACGATTVLYREGDDFCISFTDADFASSSEPLQIEVTMEPARCVIDLSRWWRRRPRNRC